MRRGALALALTLLVACSGGGQAERIEAPGVEADVELVAPPEEGAGEVPTFEWRPVVGASEYRLVVQNADGDAIWAWQGPETSIVLGAVPNRPEGETGPIVRPGTRWSVVALDSEDAVVAVSSFRNVSP